MESKKTKSISSWRIATVAGIPIRIHFTFFLLLIGMAYLAHADGRHPLTEVIFIVSVFGCVVLHELGHALTAKSFGIATEDIVLYPIGGVARLRNLGDSWQEFWITAAGPAVNFGLAALLLLGVMIRSHTDPSWLNLNENYYTWPLALRLLLVNLFLALFNLIPAFPMDGGRLARSILSYFIGRAEATSIAVWLGRIIAVAMGLFALFTGEFILLLIAVFIYFAGGHEQRFQIYHDLFNYSRAGDAMRRRFGTLNYWDTFQAAHEKTRSLAQSQFPVVDADGNLVGILNRGHIALSLQYGRGEQFISEQMSRNFPVVSSFERLATVANIFQRNPTSSVVVVENGAVAGLITPESFNEFIQHRMHA